MKTDNNGRIIKSGIMGVIWSAMENIEKNIKMEKIWTCCLAAGLIIGMYVLFKFVFPVMLPFVLAFLLALLFSPVIRFLNKKLHIKRGIATGIVMLLFLLLLFTLGNWVVVKFIGQLRNFVQNFPYYEELIFEKLYEVGENIEGLLHLNSGSVSRTIIGSFQSVYEDIQAGSMVSALMDNSVPLVRGIISTVAVVIVVLISAFLMSKDWEALKKSAGTSLFSKEIGFIAEKLSRVGSAYIKTQFILMMITMIICVGGLTIQRNPYSLLIGLLIGVLDALPLIGAGLFFIPWIIAELFMGKYLYAVGLAVIYLLCYFVREFLEPKLMGQRIGVSSLEMLIAMFLGLELFGISGLFLGPLGYILIKEVLRKPAEKA